jgi:hypothetical protein
MVPTTVNPAPYVPVPIRAITVSMQGRSTSQHAAERKRDRNIESHSMSYILYVNVKLPKRHNTLKSILQRELTESIKCTY